MLISAFWFALNALKEPAPMRLTRWKRWKNVGRFPPASVNKNTGKGRDNRDRAHIMVNSEKISVRKIRFRKILELSPKSENWFSQVVSCTLPAVSSGFGSGSHMPRV